MKNKVVTSILAFTFGLYGVHRFYLGQKLRGILHFILGMGALGITIDTGDPVIVLPVMIAFIDGILFAVMPKQEFDEKYNKKYVMRQQYTSSRMADYRPPHAQPPLTSKQKANPYKRRGIERFREYDYDGAIEDFKKALYSKYNDPAIHFNLACCYSINEDTTQSIFHLDKAITHGLVDLDKIYNHEALAFVRTTPAYDQFIANGYKIAKSEAPQQDQGEAAEDEDILEQILKLGELKERGVLTSEEFQMQKQKLFG